jgi:hypothetical protein
VRPRPTYGEIDREEVPPGNPIDLAVHRRVGRPALMRKLAMASQAVVDALGRRRRLWFVYEELLGRITTRQFAAYFDLGVEHGITAARANALPGASKAARAIAERLAQEVVRTGVPRGVAVEAAVMAAWAVGRPRRRDQAGRGDVRGLPRERAARVGGGRRRVRPMKRDLIP